MRKHYLDNIRWLTVVLVLIYHVFYLFNSVGILGAVAVDAGIKSFDALSYFVYPWFMVLLFIIAGISTRYSLQKRSHKQFIVQRVNKLLVPSTLGLFLYHFIGGYLNIKIGGGLEYIPKFMLYPISVISGTGPLWFIQMLFLFSMLIVLICKLDSKDKLWDMCDKANIFFILLLVFPIWGAAQILNMPLITVYRFGIYGLAYMLGYFVFSHDSVQEKIEKIHILLLIIAIPLGIFYVIHYFGMNYTVPDCLQSFFTNAYLWIAILAILGCGKAWFNKSTKFSAYMSRSSFGLYILHYPIVLVTCYLLYYYCNLPIIFNYIIAIAVTFILTPLLYKLFKKIPVVRYLVLGIKKAA